MKKFKTYFVCLAKRSDDMFMESYHVCATNKRDAIKQAKARTPAFWKAVVKECSVCDASD